MDYLHIHNIPFLIFLWLVYSTEPKPKLTRQFCDIFNLTCTINLLNWYSIFNYEFTAEKEIISFNGCDYHKSIIFWQTLISNCYIHDRHKIPPPSNINHEQDVGNYENK
jgi:hypothetical protein